MSQATQNVGWSERAKAVEGPWLVDWKTVGSLPPLPAIDEEPLPSFGEEEVTSVHLKLDSLLPGLAAEEVTEVRFVERRNEAELIAAYTPMVLQIAGGFQRKLPRNVLRDDLVAAGMSGLWDAVRRQLSEPSDRFDFYVRVRIRGAILDELRAQDWLPRRARAAAAEAQEKGNLARALAPAVVRFDDVSEWEQSRCLATDDSTNGEAMLHAKITRESLARAVDLLPSRERHIVSAHYFHGVKFKDLGAELGVSEPRISQLHSRAIERLRHLMNPAA